MTIVSSFAGSGPVAVGEQHLWLPAVSFFFVMVVTVVAKGLALMQCQRASAVVQASALALL